MSTPAQKLGVYKGKLRKLWHESPMYWEAYNRAKVRPGILKCEGCGNEGDYRLFEMDHSEPVVSPLAADHTVGEFAKRLNCPSSGLRALCEDCHRKKTVDENRLRGKVKREAKRAA